MAIKASNVPLIGCVTNVVKLFINLPGHATPDTAMLKNEQEKVCNDAGTENAVQISKYGSSRNRVGDSGSFHT